MPRPRGRWCLPLPVQLAARTSCRAQRAETPVKRVWINGADDKTLRLLFALKPASRATGMYACHCHAAMPTTEPRGKNKIVEVAAACTYALVLTAYASSYGRTQHVPCKHFLLLLLSIVSWCRCFQLQLSRC